MPRIPGVLLFLLCVMPGFSLGSVLEIFAKASASKNYSAQDKYTLSIYATGGLAITLIPRVRIEGRYINISSLQNRVDFSSNEWTGYFKDIKTQTKIYSAGFDIDPLGEKSAFQPFIFIGAGYFESERSFYAVKLSDGSSNYIRDSKETGVSANLGLGFKIRLARTFAVELEVYGYSTSINKPNPLVNLFGSAGFRIFI